MKLKLTDMKIKLFFLTILLGFSAAYAQDPSILTPEQQEQIRQAEIIGKYAKKQGVFLVDGSLSNFKNSHDSLLLEIDWSKVVTSSKDSETTISSERGFEEFDFKFLVYFNEQNKKGVQLTTDESQNCKYKLVVTPFSYNFTQKKIMAGSNTMISLNGFIKIIDSESNTQIAELCFNTFYKFGSKIGKAGTNESNTLKCWRIVAEMIDNGLIKLFKKG